MVCVGQNLYLTYKVPKYQPQMLIEPMCSKHSICLYVYAYMYVCVHVCICTTHVQHFNKATPIIAQYSCSCCVWPLQIRSHNGFDHITNFTRNYLHWLPIRQRVDFKICSLVYKAQHDLPHLHNGNDEADIHDSQTSSFKIGVSFRANNPEAQN